MGREVSAYNTNYVEYFLVFEFGDRCLGISVWLEISVFGELIHLLLELLLETRIDHKNNEHCAMVAGINSLYFLHKHLQGSFVGR